MKLRYYFLLVISFCLAQTTFAHVGPQNEGKNVKSLAPKEPTNRPANYREDCVAAEAQIDQSVNNVRARLLAGGDVWWNGSDGRYIVPKVTPGSGVPEKSSIFAGAVWLGGFDPGGNLKLAAQTYSTGGGEDFWPGPLDPIEGTTDREICDNWDRFFKVTGEEIDEHLRNFEEAKITGADYDEDLIPEGVKGWPARGNEFFFELRGFELPNTTQGLAAFFDVDGDGFYEPQEGDYPRIELRGCDTPQYPDEMIFWIYNDNGAPHTQSNGDAIQMEIQVQAFAYATNDEINDMTFQRYKLINRAIESIDSTYFAIWVDADLGCPDDDFVGCDIDRSLAFVYNRDMLDGITGCECNVFGQVNTYCDEVPLLGVDYFRGPLGPKKFNEDGTLRNPSVGEAPDTIVELPMSSFTYFLRNDTAPDGGTGMGDPVQSSDYYNLLSGSWKDGTPFTNGGTGYDPLSNDIIPYAFPNRPDDSEAWTMANENLEGFDTRTIQASGPFRLDPGSVNELIIGVVWVPDVQHPNPNIDPLLFADDVAQALFDNCFDITDGPDAPDVDWIELDQEIVAILTNDENTSNNAAEKYAEIDLQAPTTIPEEDRTYFFEGYKIFQLSGPNVSIAELNDPDKARVIYQVDKRNGVSEIFNWSALPNPSNNVGEPDQIWVPESQVQGQDLGVRHTFRITEDQFADGDRTLVNQKKYYFTSIAYAYNNYEEFTQFPNVLGQRRAYLEGRRNIGDGTNPYYTVIPREIVVKNLNADFGAGAEITRIDGEGAGGVFLDVKEETIAAILDGSFTGEIEYKAGKGPIDIKVYNPLAVKNGEFQLTFIDENMSNSRLDEQVNWVLTDLADGTEIASAVTIDELNEQIIGEYGFSIAIEQRPEVGEAGTGTNGVIGSEITYADPTLPEWLSFVPEGRFYPLNFFQTGSSEEFEFYPSGPLTGEPVDQDQALINISGGLFYPFILADYKDRSEEPVNNFGLIPQNSYISPAWVNEGRNFNSVLNKKLSSNVSAVRELNNVDIVFTKDKSKWSRCVIVETSNVYYSSQLEGLSLESEGGAENFDVRKRPSVGKDAGADGLPAEDGMGLTGMGWFPGYAIDVETGKRLNIFFGENSVYRPNNSSTDGLNPNYLGEMPTGGDMAFNPSNLISITTDVSSLFDLYAGGQHFVYVTDSEYDECAAIQERLDPDNGSSPFRKVRALEQITWSGMLLAAEGTQMLSYDEGLIPNDVTIKLRIDNPYQVEEGTGEFNGYPTYRIKLDSVEAGDIATEDDMDEALKAIRAVPNPYLGYSAYETSQFTNVVKITNLPANATVTIYSLDGRFIRQYKRNEAGTPITGRNRAIRTQQITPALEWDLKNSKGIPVASGVYMIHIDAPGIGERMIKWFGVQRQFDPSGL